MWDSLKVKLCFVVLLYSTVYPRGPFGPGPRSRNWYWKQLVCFYCGLVLLTLHNKRVILCQQSTRYLATYSRSSDCKSFTFHICKHARTHTHTHTWKCVWCLITIRLTIYVSVCMCVVLACLSILILF